MKYILMVICLLLTSCGGNTTQNGDYKNMPTQTNETSELPEDVLSKVRSDYSDAVSQEFIIKALIQLGADLDLNGARIPRCILFLAEGDFEAFKRYLQSAKSDWRDVIYWAEYDGDFKNHNVKQVRDFNKTFSENGI